MKIQSCMRMLIPFCAVLVVMAAGCGGNNGSSAGDAPPVGKALTAYSSCGDLASALAAAPIVEREPEPLVAGAEGGAEGEAPAFVADEQGSDSAAEPREVKEADIAISDGNYVYVLHNSGRLYIFSAQDGSAVVKAGMLDLNMQPTAMVVLGDIAAVVGNAPYASSSYGMDTQIALVDLTNRALPSIFREIEINGSYVDSRLVGGTFHVISSEWLGLPREAAPQPGDLQPVIVDSRINGGVRQDAPVADDCSRIYVPDPMRFDASGDRIQLARTHIESIDISKKDGSIVSTTSIGLSPTVAASARRLYLADWDQAYDKSSLHIFDIESDPAKAVYAGTAQFDGMLLNQFSMDEFDGMIRVAATTGRSTPGSTDNDNRVYVFKEQGGAVTLTGSLDGIASGESIWSARFVGDKAFLVTYLTVDPLISIDLSDPAHPAKAGELEVPGVSTYLVKMDESHLLSVGLDMADGMAWNGGVALSMFDVSDLAHPILDHRVVIGAKNEWTYSEANSTHKAFAFFPEENLIAIPVNHLPQFVGGDVAVAAEASADYGSKLYVFKIDAAAGFEQVAVIDHVDLIPAADRDAALMNGLAMRRALLVNGLLFSVSDYGIKAAPAGDPQDAIFGEYLPIVREATGYSPL